MPMPLANAQPFLMEPFVLYQSSLLTTYAEQLIHGFTGKPISLGGPGCTPDEALANRKTLCQTMAMPSQRLSLPRQTHTDRWILNDTPSEETADAILVTEPGVTAMVQVADCVPIILYEPERHVGAAIHAGWRGTAQQITLKTAQALIETTGASTAKMIAAIGPSAGGCCYEVSDEVVEAIQQTIPDTSPKAFLTLNANQRPQIDLKKVNALQLGQLGIAQIEIMPACTICQPNLLWSHRRGEQGRQVGFISLKAT